MDFENNENLDYQLNKIASIVIKEKRIKKNYSLEDVVNKLNNIITRQSLYRYENNEARMKNNIFKKICLALDENPADVWEEINSRFLITLNFDNAELTDISSNTTKIPVLGFIKAGIPIEAQENIIDYIDIPSEWTKGNKKYYGLKIDGDSMKPNYNENDIVIFLQTNEIQNGKDCAVMVNCTECTFKKVYVTDQGLILQPYNNQYEPMIFTKKQVEELPIRIVGIAVEKRTKL